MEKNNFAPEYTPSPKKNSTEKREKNSTIDIKEYPKHLTTYQNSVIEATNPKGLKNFSRALSNEVITHNSFTRKHIDAARAERAYDGMLFLIKKWIPTHVAIGIIANGIAESGLSTEHHKHGLWIFQWTGKRAQKFLSMKTKLDGGNDFEKQLSFMLHELETSEKATKAALESAHTPEEAARIFLIKFERPKVQNIEERSAIATWLRQFTHK